VGRTHHRRFLVAAERIANGHAELAPAQARQVSAVLRLREGDAVSVLDGSGREWSARLALVRPERAVARLSEERPPETPPRVLLTLAQVVPRGPAMDLVVAKATELGVWRIVPLEAERSVRRAAVSGRVGRWRRILAEATEQCGRRRLPDLSAPCALDEFLRGRPSDEPLFACDSGEDAVPLAQACRAVAGTPALTVLVGGEGGLSQDELERVRACAGRPVALGPRLLRAETAALAALVTLQVCLGDLAGPGA
jgi:16S rRNA (uracil1498-N3)-methyltransferase